MSSQDRISQLEQRHKQLDESIKNGYTNYLDDVSLSKMKQEKLYVKRQLTELKNNIVH
jgi:hypothetical protein